MKCYVESGLLKYLFSFYVSENLDHLIAIKLSKFIVGSQMFIANLLEYQK